MDQLLQDASGLVNALLGPLRPGGNWLFLAAGVALLLLGANGLVNGSVTLARRLGVSTLVVGLTIVAFGTSTPELAFNLNAAVQQNDEMAFGNVIGSNICNIGLVLGLSALAAPLVVSSRVVTRGIPWMLAVTGGAMGLPLLGVNYPEGAGVGAHGYGRVAGAVFLGVFAVYVLFMLWFARRATTDPVVRESLNAADYSTLRRASVATIQILLGLCLLCVGARVTEFGAVGLASDFGVSKALIGLTIVAVATSLPELVTSVVAACKGQNDIAIGNVVGSNVFNLLLIMGATSVISPVHLPPRAWSSLAMMLALTFLMLPLAMTQKRIERWEGALLLVLYGAYVGFECWQSVG